DSNSYSHGNFDADGDPASCVANANDHAQTDADAQAAAATSSAGALSGTLKAGTRGNPREFPRLTVARVVRCNRALRWIGSPRRDDDS
ncbi:MAG: hypothetical protein ACRDRB_18585, partial [Pseudonocardiaceae bacterium]